jgi:hypothetical protein
MLESFGIMDYSLLLGIHNLEKDRNNIAIEAYYEAKVGDLHTFNGAEHGSDASANPGSTLNNQNPNKSSLSTTKNWDNVFNV